MRRLIITLQVAGMLLLTTLALADAFGHDYGHTAVDLLAFVLVGRR
jgi:hypothetical protein